ncbi:hypothetical protein [Polyangium sp. y55x31]|uniref:hypothetical protein n=1 Tax=Polyangium sp. y55x31 TaxID=3042688 RepID=UPI002482EB3A|nr:hypothetical protein [Polyangium sp. y55x31]MDI1481357.1 hypothetical protein [Polyangium sp. y55x31]
MDRFAIASMLAIGLASASHTSLAADPAARDDAADIERGVDSLAVISHVDSMCQIWVNGTLRATIGPFGNSGVLTTAPSSRASRLELMARCDNAIYFKVLDESRRHCDFTIDPRVEGNELVVGPCDN